ncbi:MAG: metallophosphoesterase [Ruminococcaceae bacterium]|nr:metallophosphoesterase [Oscillospiraceae bacterium]
MDFLPKLRFIVTSDIHYKIDSNVEKERFEKGMKMAYAYAEKSSYKKIDAFFAVGDFANSGSEAEMLKFKASLDSVIKPETKINLMLASHEFHSEGGQEGAYKRLKEIYNVEADDYFELNGCPFICISTEDGCRIKEKKQEWLTGCLKDAVSKERKRPIFVFQHPHLTDTVYGSINWGDDDIIAILTDYPQVIDFSGHSHAPINDPRSIHQKFFTSLGTGSVSYFELDEFDFMYGTIPPDCKKCAQYYIVEVDDNNAVRIMPVDILSGNFFHSGYYIKTPWEPESFVYTDARAAKEAAPYFDGTFRCSIKKIEDKLNIMFSQAKTDDYRVDSYSVVIRSADTNNVLLQKKVSSSYYIYNMPEYIRFDIDFPYEKGDYIAEIYANGFWFAKSDKICVSFSV